MLSSAQLRVTSGLRTRLPCARFGALITLSRVFALPQFITMCGALLSTSGAPWLLVGEGITL